MDTTSINTMAGKWKIGVYVKTPVGWFKLFLKTIIWEFIGNVMFVEKRNGQRFISEYTFFTEDSRLFIDRREYDKTKATNPIFSSDHYSVEPISDSECWLYSFIDKKPSGKYRLKLKKQKQLKARL